jgi:hypothetical protein
MGSPVVLQEAVDLFTLAAAGMSAAYGPSHLVSTQVAEELDFAKAAAEAATEKAADEH